MGKMMDKKKGMASGQGNVHPVEEVLVFGLVILKTKDLPPDCPLVPMIFSVFILSANVCIKSFCTFASDDLISIDVPRSQRTS
jgi:hypothetical protein